MGAKIHLNGTSQEGTYTHTDTHTDIATMTESAQWADSVKRYMADMDKQKGSGNYKS